MLDPSATILTPDLTKASASAAETSFCVAPGRAIWTLERRVQGRWPENHKGSQNFGHKRRALNMYRDGKCICPHR